MNPVFLCGLIRFYYQKNKRKCKIACKFDFDKALFLAIDPCMVWDHFKMPVTSHSTPQPPKRMEWDTKPFLSKMVCENVRTWTSGQGFPVKICWIPRYWGSTTDFLAVFVAHKHSTDALRRILRTLTDLSSLIKLLCIGLPTFLWADYKRLGMRTWQLKKSR